VEELQAGGAGKDSGFAARVRREEIKPWQDDLERTVFGVRHVSTLALAGCAALIPAVGPDRQRIALAILCVVLPWDILMHWWSNRGGRLPVVMPYANQILGAGFVALAPATFIPVLLVLLSDIGLAAAIFGRRVAATAVAMGSVLVGVASFGVYDGIRITGMFGYVIAASGLVLAVGALFEDERRLRNRYLALLGDVDAIVWEATPSPCHFTYVSGRALDILGYPASAWQDDDNFWHDHLHPYDRERVLDEDGRAIEEGQDHELEYRMVAADGRTVHLRDLVTVVTDNNGRPVSLRGVMVDITAQRAAEERVRQYADLVERIQMALLIMKLVDREDPSSFEIVAVNPEAREMAREPGEDVVGLRLLDAFPALSTLGLHEQLAEVIRRGEPYDLDEVVPESAGQEERHFSVHAFPLGDDMVGVSLDDVTGPSMAARALRRQATHDALTGLPNRALMNDRLRQALREAPRSKKSVALLMMDLDQFKEINDALGHHAGDRLLIALSRRLENVLRDADTIARLGGDEFAVLLTTDATHAGAVTVARKITSALEQPFELEGLSLQTNASVGIALFPEHADDPESLTKRADVAMYMAKRSSRPFAVYDPGQDRSSVRRVTLLGELRRALELDELVLFHQPAFDLRTGEIVGTEALVRWQHPVHGLMSPGEFVDLAEVSGMIHPLTRWAIRTAIEHARSWANGEPPTVGVAVNLSVRNLYDAELTRWMGEVLEETGFPPSLITLEITESEVMDDPLLAVEVLGALHELGVHTSIDDFGTGQSSLSYLKHLPIDEIKIDRSFVGGMCTNASDETIVRAIVDLGHNLGLRVVAEGVEENEMVRRLRMLDCDRAQGFYLSKPLSPGDVTRVLQQELPLRVALLRR
jgi:diguanylate cyclase (GGDEF)-like protein/PAS domain S-box-containing protein